MSGAHLSSPTPEGPVRRVCINLVEESYLNVDGGRGWVDEYWSILTNDGWTMLAQLRHRAIGDVRVVEDKFDQLPAGRRFYRDITIEAPIGTLVMKRVRRSEFSGVAKTVLELRGEGRLVRPRSPGEQAERVARRIAPEQRLSAEDTCKHAAALLALLDKAS
jgi:hypothetical protein